MVTIVPQDNPFDLFGQKFGSGFAETLPAALERRQERTQIQKGLKSIEDMSPQELASMNPMQAMAKILGPFAGTRQGAQYAEAVMPQLQKLMQTAQGGSSGAQNAVAGIEGLMGGAKQSQEFPTFLDAKAAFKPEPKVSGEIKIPPTMEQAKDLLVDKFGEAYFPNVKEPTSVEGEESYRPQKPLKPPKVISASDKQRARMILNESGISNKDVQDSIIGDWVNFQRESYDAAKEGFQNVQEYQKARQEEDNRFFQAAEPSLQAAYGQMNPMELNIWKGLSRLAENEGPDEARFRQTTQMFDNMVREPLRRFEEQGPNLPMGSLLQPNQVKENLEEARSLVQDQLKALDSSPLADKKLKGEMKNYLRDEYRAKMSMKDWGEAQAAYAVSNLGDKSKQRFSRLPNVPQPIHQPGMLVSQAITPQQRDRYVSSLAEVLNGLSEDDSLILARESAIDKGYDESMFNEAMRRSLQQGKMLSDFQRTERPLLSKPQRIDLNSIMEGKRSFWDIFKAKK